MLVSLSGLRLWTVYLSSVLDAKARVVGLVFLEVGCIRHNLPCTWQATISLSLSMSKAFPLYSRWWMPISWHGATAPRDRVARISSFLGWYWRDTPGEARSGWLPGGETSCCL
ncbi:hypothetical protein QBC33DRAFT_542503 [Phialemonium atrogriseum]|uniref:Secreted protein n=1 Tax=Phialemonium atrogriseum TaxID=1093897 RepID=A0AAJ0FMN4_9PEZI|nr:uncharacterized protein QBC33DRAFT_542503 [Phialemonium atrogriseum]KAK1766320.1 hypothetical protein QBC33DRAFT_542503 [Phialemonium atrogriseum]